MQVVARFTDVDLFLAVADVGSFRGAAQRLAVTSSTVSRGVQRLEEHLGAPLFLRDTRNLRLTEAGAAYLRHARRAAVSLTEAERSVASVSDTVSGTLRVSCTNIVAQTLLRSIVTEFLQTHPDVAIDLVLTPRLVNPLLDDVDLAIRVGRKLEDSDLRSRVLLRSRVIVVGTPEVAAHIDAGHSVPFLAFNRLGAADQLLPPVPYHTRMSADDYPVLLQAVRSGVGVAVADEALVRAELRSGALVQTLGQWKLPTLTYWAVYPKAGRLPANLRAFLAAVTEGLGRLRS